MFPDVRSLSDQTYEWLKERIFSGSLAPGRRVSIDAIASEIGVSRTPIRDAINRLSHEGLVVVTPRRGTVVGSLTIKDVEDIYDVRILIEPGAAESVARTASPEFLADLQKIHSEWAQLDPSAIYFDFAKANRYTELDTQFHLRIIAELGNGLLNQIAEQTNIQRRIAPRLYRSNFRGPQQRMTEHQRILDAIVARDGTLARRELEQHLHNAKRDLVGYLRVLEANGRGPAEDTSLEDLGRGDGDGSASDAARLQGTRRG